MSPASLYFKLKDKFDGRGIDSQSSQDYDTILKNVPYNQRKSKIRNLSV